MLMNSKFIPIAIGISGYYQLVLIVVVFIGMLFAAYYTTRFVGNVSMNSRANSNMKIIEAIMVGPQKTLQIVKVNNQYFLIGVTKDRIALISEIDGDQVNECKIADGIPQFKDILKDKKDQFLKKNK